MISILRSSELGCLNCIHIKLGPDPIWISGEDNFENTLYCISIQHILHPQQAVHSCMFRRSKLCIVESKPNPTSCNHRLFHTASCMNKTPSSIDFLELVVVEWPLVGVPPFSPSPGKGRRQWYSINCHAY